MYDTRSKINKGFTLVELIIVIVIIAILSISASSYLSKKPVDNVNMARAQALSVVRQIQTTAMQHSIDSNLCGILNVSATVIAGPVGASSVSNCLRDSDVTLRSDYLDASRIDKTNRPLVTFTLGVAEISAASALYFDLFGRPYFSPTVSDATQRACQSADCTITIKSTDDPSVWNQICINKEGFINEISAGSSPGDGC